MPSTRRNPVVARLLFGVALAFTAIGLLETAFITYAALTGAMAFDRAPDLGLGVRSWTEHHAHRPGYSEGNFHTNSFGLRSPEVAVPKPAGTFRILMLGDSFTFGFGVKESDGFVRVLERQWRNDPGPSSIEVVNAGVVSYCPLLEFLQYRQHLHVLEPDLVILNFDMSDVQDHMMYAPSTSWSSDGTPLFATEPSLGKLPTLWPDLLSFRWIGRRLNAVRGNASSTVAGAASVRDVDRYAWTLDDGPAMEREAKEAMAPIAALSTLLKHHQIPFLVATYPQPWQVSREATPLPPIREQYGIGLNAVHLNDRPFKALEAFARQHNIPLFNATAAFRQDPRPVELFLGNDFHFSPKGNELYASLLRRYIVENGLRR